MLATCHKVQIFFVRSTYKHLGSYIAVQISTKVYHDSIIIICNWFKQESVFIDPKINYLYQRILLILKFTNRKPNSVHITRMQLSMII